MRAAAYARGVSLPSRGSAQDLLLVELGRRERRERYAVARLFVVTLFTLARALGLLLAAANNLKMQPVTDLWTKQLKFLEEELERYWSEVSQERYEPSIIGRALRAQTRSRTVSDQEILQKVQKLSK